MIDEEKLNSIFCGLKDELFSGGYLIASLYPDYRMLYANSAMLRMLGYGSFDELRSALNGSFISFVHPDDLKRIKSEGSDWQKRHNGVYEISYRIMKKDGSSEWVTQRSHHIIMSDGAEAIFASYSFISSERERVLAIESQNALLQKELSYMAEPQAKSLISRVVGNLTRNRIEFSAQKKSLARSFDNYTCDAATCQLSGTAYLPEDRERIASIVNRKYLTEHFPQRAEYSFEYLRMLLNGTVSWVNSIVKCYADPLTKDVKAYVYSYDINSYRMPAAVLQKLAEADCEMLGLLYPQTNYFAFIKTHSTDSIDNNNNYNAVRDLYVKSMDKNGELENLRDLLDADAICRRLNASGGRFSEALPVFLNGVRKYKRWEFLDYNKDNVAVIIRRTDVTDAVENEIRIREKLLKALQDVRTASRAKTVFLSQMSHDIRTPMNVIINLAELAADELDKPEKLKEDISKIKTSATFLLGLINDILDMSSIESGNMKLAPSVYTFANFVNYMESIAKPLSEKRGVSFSWEKGSTTLDVFVDVTRFNQIFYNIISNAMKYTLPGGSVKLSIRNNIVENNVLECDFMIADTGVGISEDFQKKMFRPFERSDAVSANVGTGLGLTITKRIVELMHGTITIDSKVGKGTTVTVHIPMPLATAQQRAAASAMDAKSRGIALASASGDKTRMILLAEDHPLNQEILKRILEKGGYNSECATNGKEAVNAFTNSAAGHYSAILMDIRMPVMDGLTATKAIRSLKRPDAKTIPIIAMTANAFEEDEKKSLEAGMNAHISKPVDPVKIFGTLKRLIR